MRNDTPRTTAHPVALAHRRRLAAFDRPACAHHAAAAEATP
ncbi:hypothetical protein [Streptomyces sp. CFMR 7]|nr:hypothetical protein [Streptomyces sp. CFMR 7]